ncbi:MAG: hypothetical protein EXQ59_01525 [Acidobacteria bacterium]|nr:hypothetical protein [Acidobacteriota bacterium]
MRLATFWVAGALLAAPGMAIADVADYLGKPVMSMRVQSEGRPVGDAVLLGLIETRLGEPLSMRAVRETIGHLFLSGRYEDVRVEAEAVPGGVRLTYDLVPIHPVKGIVFAGQMSLAGIDESRLRRIVVERYGASPPVGRRFDLARVVEEELARAGYLHATVVPRIDVAHAPDRATLVFTIQPGIRTVIGRIEVAGSPGMSTSDLLDRLRLRPGEPYERDALALRVQEYRQRQSSSGYVEAALSVATSFEDGDRTVHLRLTAARGPRVKVDFRGDPIPRDKQEELVPIAEEASVDEEVLEDATRALEGYLRGIGHRDATAPHARTDVDGSLVITFTIARGPFYRVSDVVIAGNPSPTIDLLAPRLGVRKGQPFADAGLETDASSIEDVYRRLGFSEVRVETSVEATPAGVGADVAVAVRITIIEGVRTVVGSVSVRGNQSVPESDVTQGLGLQAGRPFFLTQMAVDRDAIQLRYVDRGYQNATVEGNPGIGADGTVANLVFTVNEGPRMTVGHVIVVGNERTKIETIERALQFKAGDPLGLAAVVESQRRLAELGLFRRVRISQVPHGEEARRDLVVTVEESPVTTVGYGGGLETGQRVRTEAASGAAVQRLEFAPRAFFEIGRRNLFGKNRSVNLFARVSLRPDPAQSTTDGGLGFSEYRVFGAFREPRLFDTAADAFLIATLEQQSRSSFNLSRRGLSAEVTRRLTPTVNVGGNYQLQRTELFNENIAEEDQLLIDRLFPQVVLSSFSASSVLNTRDDAVNPTSGHLLSASGQFAARRIGSEVGLFKSYLTAQFFRTLPRTRGTVLATSVRLGMAYGFPRTVVQRDGLGNPIIGPDGAPVTEVARDLPVSERFFAGGDTTVRGFALDQLGAPSTLDTNGFAIGGNAVLILNAELRVPIRGSIGVIGFIDAGNVFARTNDISLRQLRSAVGFGVRYRSPIGPIRVDVGYKTRRREVVPGRRESANSVHISLGQAF